MNNTLSSIESLSVSDLKAIREMLSEQGNMRDLALFEGLCSGLRVSELLNTRAAPEGTGRDLGVVCFVKKYPMDVDLFVFFEDVALERWIRESNVKPGGYLFPNPQNDQGHMTLEQLRRITMGWFKILSFDKNHFSMLSFRTSIMCRECVANQFEDVAQSTGHASQSSASAYIYDDGDKKR